MAEYEVEKILDSWCIQSNKLLFFIKWKNYDDEYNTWEPAHNLEKCSKLMLEYTKQGPDKERSEYDKVESYLSQHNEFDLISLLRKFRTKTGKITKLQQPDADLITSEIETFVLNKKLFFSQRDFNRAKNLLLTKLVYEKRSAQLFKLKEVAAKYNSVCPNEADLTIENNYDFEVPPEDFTYISRSIARGQVPTVDEPVIWCTCANNCKSKRDDCCWEINNSDPPYDSRTKKLILDKGTPIFECNEKCSCDSNCSSRIVQKGCQIPLTIFKTNNERGWGVKTVVPIKAGLFVCEYFGEILTHEDSLSRTNQTYIFNLDFNEENKYVIDARYYGNVSHFINHSCNPNLEVFAVYINDINPDLHHVALFAKRDIAKNEELSFCYLDVKKKSTNEPRPKFSKKTCLCGSEQCKGYYYLS